MTEEKPQIATPQNNKTRMPIEHYSAEFAKADPLELSKRCGVPYDGESQQFTVRVIGRPVLVKWPEMQTSYADTGEATKDNLRILMGRLLLEGQLVPGTGKFIPYTQVPWGQTYIQAFTGRCIKRLAFMFKDAGSFANACEELGGKPLSEGDASYEFEFVDGEFVRLTVWEADDEFPPSAQIMFSDNIPLAFTAEDLATVGDILLGELKAAGKRVAK